MTGLLSPGAVLDGRYTVVRLVAEGGMSIVYEVRDARLPGRYALKHMREWVGDESMRRAIVAQFEREAEILSGMSHPNLPRVTDHFVYEGRRCLVEELVDGDTLEAVGTVAEDEVAGWAVQICDALEYLHSKGIIYRDLKPSNCMLGADGTIKLIDFGIVRFFSLGKSRDTVIMGTPGFAAPEQYGREQTDPRADIFALGVLLHHLLTGHDPAETPFVFPPPRRLNPSISPRMEQIVLKAVSLDPADRFQQVSGMRDALRGEIVLLEDEERFGYAEEPPRREVFASQVAGVTGLGVGTVFLTVGSPLFMSLAACYLPAWLFLMVIEYTGRRRRAATAIRVTREGVAYTCETREVRAAWDEVTSLVFVRDAFLRARLARVRTTRGEFSFVTETTTGQDAVLGIRPIEDGARLIELILRGARLAAAGPGADSYER
ncbi:MAG: serine/threonine protein kinase [Armatimonadetes bacterium]|nr:serine/threonine protein kinase [Armatimonadota bacterium]